MSSSSTLPLAAVTLTQPRSNSTRTVPSVSSVLSATMTSPFSSPPTFFESLAAPFRTTLRANAESVEYGRRMLN